MSNSNFWLSKAHIKEFNGENAWIERGLADGSIDEDLYFAGLVATITAAVFAVVFWLIGYLFGYWTSVGTAVVGAVLGFYIGISFAMEITAFVGLLIVLILVIVGVKFVYEVLWAGYEIHLDAQTKVVEQANLLESPSIAAPVNRTVESGKMIRITGAFQLNRYGDSYHPVLILDDEISLKQGWMHMGEIGYSQSVVKSVFLLSGSSALDSFVTSEVETKLEITGHFLSVNDSKGNPLSWYDEGALFQIESVGRL